MFRKVFSGFYWFTSAAIALMSLTVIGIATSIGFAQVAPHLVHYAAELRLPLYMHVVFAPLALALAPFQFISRLRGARPKIHRLIGYSYFASVIIAGIGSLIMLFKFQGTVWAGSGFFLLSILWIGATSRAVFLARNKRFAEHKKWMMRSAALTFAAVTLRLFMVPLVASGMTIVETYNITAWASWLVPLVAVELWLRRRGTKRST